MKTKTKQGGRSFRANATKRRAERLVTQMKTEDQERWLWSSADGYGLYFTNGANGLCHFNLVRSANDQRHTIVLEWRHNVKTITSLCCICASQEEQDESQTHCLKIVWNSLETIYCDYLKISGNQPILETEPLIDVSFTICGFYVIWKHGIVLVEEANVRQLHIFETSLGRYLGYLTLFANIDSDLELTHMINFDNETSKLWAIVRKYDALTKKSSAYLNTYAIPNFKLLSSVQLPRGFTKYGLIKKPTSMKLEVHELHSLMVYSSCDLFEKTTIQWFLSPTTPWKEICLDYLVPLRTIETSNH